MAATLRQPGETPFERPSSQCPNGCDVDLVRVRTEASNGNLAIPDIVACPECLNPVLVESGGVNVQMLPVPGMKPLWETAPPESVMGELFRRLHSHVESIPTPPEIPRHVISRILDPLSSIGELAPPIESDAGFSMRVMRLANSPAYRGQDEVVDIKVAAGRIGMKVLLNLAHVLSHHAAYRCSDPDLQHTFDRMWRHAVATAHFAEAIGGSVPGANTKQLFLAGLSHDLGKVVLLGILVNHSHRTGVLLESPDRLFKVLTAFGPLATLHVAQHWKFDPAIRQIALFLADPERIPNPRYRKGGHIVALASRMADAIGYGIEAERDDMDWIQELTGHLSFRELRLNRQTIGECFRNTRPQVDVLVNVVESA